VIVLQLKQEEERWKEGRRKLKDGVSKEGLL
jgi:hypothetical protein